MDKQRKRRANFSDVEKNNLLEVVGECMDGVEDKRCSNIATIKPDEALNTMEDRFNAASDGIPRTIKQLKGYWYDIKKKARSEVSLYR